jgi:hypothetical protein
MKRLAVAVALAAIPAAAQGPGWVQGQTAELQALDKVTARISTIEARVGQRVRFGTLEIEVAACHRRPADEQPDAAAWLTVKDNRLNGQRVFAGWMFAASPALNMLEHAVYDLRVLECR